MKTVQLYQLREFDFKEHDKVQVTTRLASIFTIERVRRGVYMAHNKTEWKCGFKVYRSLDDVRHDLAIR